MRFFAGDPIPGLVERATVILNQMPKPVEFDDWATAVERDGFTDPRVRGHLEWLAVNDPRVVRGGKRIRRYTGPTDEPEVTPRPKPVAPVAPLDLWPEVQTATDLLTRAMRALEDGTWRPPLDQVLVLEAVGRWLERADEIASSVDAEVAP